MFILEFFVNRLLWAYALLCTLLVILLRIFLFISFLTLSGTGMPLLFAGIWKFEFEIIEMGIFLTLGGFFLFYLLEKSQNHH